jgi:hypothetical protein
LHGIITKAFHFVENISPTQGNISSLLSMEIQHRHHVSEVVGEDYHGQGEALGVVAQPKCHRICALCWLSMLGSALTQKA